MADSKDTKESVPHRPKASRKAGSGTREAIFIFI